MRQLQPIQQTQAAQSIPAIPRELVAQVFQLFPQGADGAGVHLAVFSLSRERRD
jgi:hypothetical protein